MEKARMLGLEQAVVVGGTEGGRSPTEVPPTTAAPAGPPAGNEKPMPDPAVLEKPVRRQFAVEYKIRILREADRCTEPGQLGALLRREGLYSSRLSTWRQQRERGMLAGLAPKQRGPQPNPDAPLIAENQRLTRRINGWRPSFVRPKRLSTFKKNFPRCWGSSCRRPRTTGASHEGR